MEDMYMMCIGYLLIPHNEAVSKTAFQSVDALMAYLERMKDDLGSFRDGFTVERCEFIREVE